jgi:histone H3/H4
MTDPNSDKEILVVASKIKKYVRSVAGMSTSANVLPKLSDAIRSLCDQAIENAKTDGRKTVMDRDFT